MQEKVLQYIRKHQMIERGDRILTALSGGRDSVCLLRMLAELAESLGISLAAVHIHHGIRGSEADRDAAFCEELCNSLGIPFFLYRYEVKEIAAKERLSLEEAGRKVRYQAFEDCAKQWGADKTALAHHRNDTAETFLFHLARGSSITGLGGIRPVRGRVIRPFLCLERDEISAWMEKRGWAYLDDSTNREALYTRNRIRHQIIPLLQDGINGKSVEHIARAAEELQEIEAYLKQETEKIEARYLRRSGAEVLLSAELRDAPEVLGKRLALHALELAGGTKKDLCGVHVEALWELLGKPAGKRQNLPGNLLAVREKNQIRLYKNEPESAEIFQEQELFTDQEQQWGPYRVRSREILRKEERFPEKAYTKWIDYGRIKQKLSLRTRRTGDFISTCRDGGKKKLKDYMIDAGIPREQRDRILLIADGQEIVWVVGYRLSERYKISDATEKILSIEIQGGSTNE